MIRIGRHANSPARAGITLTEILIGIMILGVGLVSIATLFPIGLIRLREAQRQSRSALLYESAAADMAARNLINPQSFIQADNLNAWLDPMDPRPWFPSATRGQFNPLLQDAPEDGLDPYPAVVGGIPQGIDTTDPIYYSRGGTGIPFAYDPLWRYQVVAPGNPPTLRGMYPHDVVGGVVVPEARFGSGIGFIRNDPTGGLPSAHGLQRVTNFNGRIYAQYTDPSGTVRDLFAMQSTNSIPRIFVSPEDIVMNDPTASIWSAADGLMGVDRSPILPDHTLGRNDVQIGDMLKSGIRPTDETPVNEWRYSWLFTGRLSSSTNASTFDGDLVIYENRPFELEAVPSPLNPANTIYKPADEIVVEAVFGHGRSVNIMPGYGNGYAAAADRTVLLRWPSAMADPIVKIGDWICDVTYERRQLIAHNIGDPTDLANTGDDTGRFIKEPANAGSAPNPMNGGKLDNLPAQRAFWYQVSKVSAAVEDAQVRDHRSMVVQVNSALRARTALRPDGSPAVLNAALIAPHVVNVIPQTITVH